MDPGQLAEREDNSDSTEIGLSGAVVGLSRHLGGLARKVHSASGAPGVDPIQPGVIFEIGGFGPGQNATLVFLNAGSYAYSSGPDCLHGNNSPPFPCATTNTVVVVP